MYLMVANIKHEGKSIKRVAATEENNFLINPKNYLCFPVINVIKPPITTNDTIE